jgi:chromosome segregation ATPase
VTGGPEASEGKVVVGSEVSRTITEWVDECRNWTGALLDALRSLEAVNEKARTLERENAQLRDGLAELRREISDIDADRTELRTALQDLARQLAQVVDLTRRHPGK